MKFTRNPAKAKKNARKHGVSFDDAELVFSDPLALIEDDPHPDGDRCRIIGRPRAYAEAFLFVVYVEVDADTVHIISARHATRHERRRYEEG